MYEVVVTAGPGVMLFHGVMTVGDYDEIGAVCGELGIVSYSVFNSDLGWDDKETFHGGRDD